MIFLHWAGLFRSLFTSWLVLYLLYARVCGFLTFLHGRAPTGDCCSPPAWRRGSQTQNDRRSDHIIPKKDQAVKE